MSEMPLQPTRRGRKPTPPPAPKPEAEPQLVLKKPEEVEPAPVAPPPVVAKTIPDDEPQSQGSTSVRPPALEAVSTDGHAQTLLGPAPPAPEEKDPVLVLRRESEVPPPLPPANEVPRPRDTPRRHEGDAEAAARASQPAPTHEKDRVIINDSPRPSAATSRPVTGEPRPSLNRLPPSPQPAEPPKEKEEAPPHGGFRDVDPPSKRTPPVAPKAERSGKTFTVVGFGAICLVGLGMVVMHFVNREPSSKEATSPSGYVSNANMTCEHPTNELLYHVFGQHDVTAYDPKAADRHVAKERARLKAAKQDPDKDPNQHVFLRCKGSDGKTLSKPNPGNRTHDVSACCISRD